MNVGLARSVHVRLVRHAKMLGVDTNLVLARYATERLLYRLSRSPHVDRFVLKGGWSRSARRRSMAASA